MMKESEYLIQVLKEWCSRFEGIHVRYAYDANTSYHIIEVDPENIRRGSEQYKQAELGLWISFAEKFPESDLLVCKPARSNDMSNCLFQNKRDSFIFPELIESEDERIRKAIESVIRVYGKTQGEWIAGYDMDALVANLNRLKSLRPQPHWKPSEEQMNHLKRCFSHGHTIGLPNQHVLESLYNYLKKL